MWLSILALGCVPMKIPLYLCEKKLSQERETPSPKGFLSYIFDFPTVIAVFCLGSTEILPATLLPDNGATDAFIYFLCIFTVVVPKFVESYRKNLDSKWMLKSNLRRVHAAGALDVERPSLPITTPFPLPFDGDGKTILETARLTSEEEEAIIKQRTFRPSFSITIAEITLFILLYIVAFLTVFIPTYNSGSFTMINAFGIATLGKKENTSFHFLATGVVLFLLFIHPILVTVYFLGKFCEQKADLSGDS